MEIEPGGHEYLGWTTEPRMQGAVIIAPGAFVEFDIELLRGKPRRMPTSKIKSGSMLEKLHYGRCELVEISREQPEKHNSQRAHPEHRFDRAQ